MIGMFILTSEAIKLRNYRIWVSTRKSVIFQDVGTLAEKIFYGEELIE